MGGFFVSDVEGDDWSLVSFLWDYVMWFDDELGWMGGGCDEFGIYLICVDF